MKPCQNPGELLKGRGNRFNLQLLAEGGTRQADEQVSPDPLGSSPSISPSICLQAFLYQLNLFFFKWCGTNGAVPQRNDASQRPRPFFQNARGNYEGGEKKPLNADVYLVMPCKKGAKSVGGV